MYAVKPSVTSNENWVNSRFSATDNNFSIVIASRCSTKSKCTTWPCSFKIAIRYLFFSPISMNVSSTNSVVPFNFLLQYCFACTDALMRAIILRTSRDKGCIKRARRF